MVTLVAGFDVSKDEQRKYLVMAGFVSSAERWGEFDVEWRQRLGRDGLSFFHMVDFAHSREQFDGWRDDELRRRALLSDLLGIAAAHAYRKFGIVIAAEAFQAISEEARKRFSPSPIAMAGRVVVAMVEEWRLREKYRRPADLTFEDGDVDKGTLIQAIMKVTSVAPEFRSKKDQPAKGIEAFTPLQAADVLAYEIMQIAKTFGKSVPPDTQFRFPYQELNKIHGLVKVLTPGTVEATESYMDVVRHFDDHPLGSDTAQ